MKLLVLLLATWCIAASASEPANQAGDGVYECPDDDGTIDLVDGPPGRDDCALVGTTLAVPYTMIHQQPGLQVMARDGESVRDRDHVELTLIYNFPAAADGAVRSALRRQRFDCRDGGGVATLEERTFERPVARGEPREVTRTPEAVSRPIEAGSVEARVRAIACRQ
jgi:hypothetical protein